MNYTPNFTDPRIIKALTKALDWCSTYLNHNRQQWLSTREIQRQLGSQSRPLGRWLKNRLLICTNPYYNSLAGVCKSYKLNPDGYTNICAIINYIPKIKVNIKQQQELDTGEFLYVEKSNREYHPLQNLPKRIKQPLLNARGYRHEYDIQCCAQTLILQHARQLGFAKATPLLELYINDRTDVRSNISKRTGLDTATVKKILTAILNGGTISAWHENMIFSYVDYNRLMIDILREDVYIQGYQREVRDMWKFIRSYQSLERGERFNAKMKSGIYRQLEESVRVVIKRHLRRTHNRAFIEHDGWSCQSAVDIDQLKLEVKQQTGFVIELDWTIHEYVDAY
jgi:hypothetical protein